VVLYYFHLRRDGNVVRDTDGTECADLAAAQAHAVAVATELMENVERNARPWAMEVCNDACERVFGFQFAEIDRTLDHLAPPARALVEEMCRRRAGLVDTIRSSRTVVRQARALIGRAQGRPYMVAESGAPVLGQDALADEE